MKLLTVKFKNLIGSNNSSMQGAIYTVGNIFPQIVRMLLLPLFTRYLSPEEYGIINYTNSICTFLFILTILSLNSFVGRHYFDCKTEDEKKRMFGSIFLFMMLLSGAFLILELSAGQTILLYTNVQVPFSPYFQLAFLNVALEIFLVLPRIYFRVRKEAKKFIIFTIGNTILNIVMSLIFVVYFGMGILGRYYGMLIANLVFAVISLVIIWRISTFVLDLKLIKKGLAFAMPILPSALCGILMSVSDRIILERYVSLSVLGLYSVGSMVGQMPLSALSNGIYKAVEPNIYGKFNEKGFDQYIVYIKKYCLSVILLFAIPIGLFSQEILMIMAAPKFHSVFMIVPIFVLSVIVQTIAMPAMLYLYATRKTQFAPLITFVGVGVNIGTSLWLIPRIGIYGAAVSTLLAVITSYLVNILIIERISLKRIQWGYLTDFFKIFLVSLPILFFVYVPSFSFIVSIPVKFLILCAYWIIFGTRLLSEVGRLENKSQQAGLSAIWKKFSISKKFG
ncbi:MAG: oligosaccharide flippase family protein [Deltaproteobacteria bacterium]|nr:oligosaccharide flippase family protein [Deltaproteobacteria bacterium]